MTRAHDGSNAEGASRLLLEQGVVLGGGSEGALAEAPVVTLQPSIGGLVMATTHHGAGYKSTNEDRIVVIETEDGDGLKMGLLVVDGMGGHQHGDLAAQILSEEFIRTFRLGQEQVDNEARTQLLQQIAVLVGSLPSQDLVRSVRAKIQADLRQDPAFSPDSLMRSAREAVQSESIQLREPTPGNLRKVAEILQALSNMRIPDAVELAIRGTRARIDTMGYKSDRPDACFVGATIRTTASGKRILDVRQIGDCKIIISDKHGHIRFESIGESMISEPDLYSEHITLAELMTYSLHRNVVLNSVNSPKLVLRRYRRDHLPLELNSGDTVFLCSDGVDDIFTARELVGLRQGHELRDFFRLLLALSQKRMEYVGQLLREQRSRIPGGEPRGAYPIIHRLMNEGRILNGCFVESYGEGSVGRWTKPPKCDNTAMCALVVGDPP